MGEIVQINNNYYTSNFHLDIKTDSDFKVGSNFFSVNVVKDSTLDKSLQFEFPRRTRDGELFYVKNGELLIDKSLFKNIDKYITNKDCKIALAIWICRNHIFNDKISASSIIEVLNNLYSLEL